MAALGLHCCSRALSSCDERGLLFVVVHGLLIAVASLCCGARALGAQASVVVARGPRGMWDLPRPGLEPVSPALAGGFLTTAPPGKPIVVFLNFFLSFPPECGFHEVRGHAWPGLSYIQLLPLAHGRFSTHGGQVNA